MESYVLKDLTLALFKRVMEESEFSGHDNVGVVIQAYLRNSEKDLCDMIAWAKSQQKRITVRLVKGAYWDYETVLAQQKGWPIPVFTNKKETDANYENLTTLMLQNNEFIQSAFGSHNIRSITHAIAQAEQLGVHPYSYEIQMLYGMADSIKSALVKHGFRVREYAPVGELIPGMAYLVRRLLENTSNEGFLRAKFTSRIPIEELLKNPKSSLSNDRGFFPCTAGPSEVSGSQQQALFNNAPPHRFQPDRKPATNDFGPSFRPLPFRQELSLGHRLQGSRVANRGDGGENGAEPEKREESRGGDGREKRH
jgi:RHH-type transcriptional regulator, proline utilization regulon repressor / proline dehydrogenase / delta 1-pyrroline-5-carboxylate dehydrogenase